MPERTPEQASQGRKRQTNRLPSRSARTPCVRFGPAGRARGLFGPTTGPTWRNRCVSTARWGEPRARCVLNHVAGYAAESLLARYYSQASQRLVSYVESSRVAYLCLACLYLRCRKQAKLYQPDNPVQTVNLNHLTIFKDLNGTLDPRHAGFAVFPSHQGPVLELAPHL